jgi:hypothetical protein
MNTRTTVQLASMIVLALAGSAEAQTTPEIAPCGFRFGSGAFVWCVSESGTLTRLTSPAGAEHIRVGNVNEGYVVCAANASPYYDAGSSSSGWGAPVVVPDPVVPDPVVPDPVVPDPVVLDPVVPDPVVADSVAADPVAAESVEDDPDDPSTDVAAEATAGSGITIERSTIDGRFTLRQVFSANKGDRSITVAMTLTNNLEEATAVQLLRSADLDIDNTFNGDVFDKSADAAWARQAHSVTLSALNRNLNHQTRVSSNLAPRTCLPTSFFGIPAVNADLAASIRYDVGTLAAGGSKTLRFRYRVQ